MVEVVEVVERLGLGLAEGGFGGGAEGRTALVVAMLAGRLVRPDPGRVSWGGLAGGLWTSGGGALSRRSADFLSLLRQGTLNRDFGMAPVVTGRDAVEVTESTLLCFGRRGEAEVDVTGGD